MKQIFYIGAAVIIAIFLTAVVVVGLQKDSIGGGAGQVAISCDTSTVAAASVGNQLSSTLLAAYSNRAWSRIERVDNSSGVATNTVHVSFDEGAAATVNSGITLGTTTQFIDFGLNTDFPYVGAVTGITDTGSTTVRITECRY